jgi:cell division protein ZipA
MELREWLIILGLALVTLIVVDGVRRLQRQRKVPRLDEVADDAGGTDLDPDEAARAAELNWELPNGGARVVRPADYSRVQPKPKLERQEHPGASRVLASFREAREPVAASADRVGKPQAREVAGQEEHARQPDVRVERKEKNERKEQIEALRQEEMRQEQMRQAPEATPAEASIEPHRDEAPETASRPVASDAPATPEAPSLASPERREPSLSALDESPSELDASLSEPLAADPEDHDESHEAERYRLVDLDGMSDSFKSGSKRVGASVQRFGASLQKTLAERREQKRLEKQRRDAARAEKAAREAEQRRLAQARAEEEKAARDAERRRLEAEAIADADDDDPLFAAPRARRHDDDAHPDVVAESDALPEAEGPALSDKVRVHPVLEKALRHDVSAEHARHALSHADEIIVISVMSRDEEGFSGTTLLDLMLACGLRYSRDMGIFHRFETEDPESQLQFSMVNVVKPGTFPIHSMDDFRTPGITLLMPLPGAEDASAAFEAMVETAMVIVRHLGGELKDENHSVMTAQTVEFARQRVQEFVRRNRLNRYQVN